MWMALHWAVASLRSRTTPITSVAPGPELKHLPDPHRTSHSTNPLPHFILPGRRGVILPHPWGTEMWVGGGQSWDSNQICSIPKTRHILQTQWPKETSAKLSAESFSKLLPSQKSKSFCYKRRC